MLLSERMRLLMTRFSEAHAFNLDRICLRSRETWDALGGANRLNEADCLEIGAGSFNPIGVGAVLILNGARRVWSTDFGHLHNECLMARGLYECLVNALAFPQQWNF